MLVVKFCENDEFNEVTLQATDEEQNKSQRRSVIRQGTDVMFVNMKLQEIKLHKSYMSYQQKELKLYFFNIFNNLNLFSCDVCEYRVIRNKTLQIIYGESI